MIELWIVGAGGHSRVLIDTARSSGAFTVKGLLDDNPAIRGSTVCGVPVYGPISPQTVEELGIRYAVLGIGDNRSRRALDECLGPYLTWATVVHEHACISPYADLGEGTVVFAGSVVQSGSRIGRHVIINTLSTIDHDTRVHDYAHVASARLGGRSIVRSGALIGIGATLLPGITVGEWAVLGSGAAANKDVPPGAIAVGVPAVVRSVTPVPDLPRETIVLPGSLST